ncbi:MAG TPA: hypothetical protein VGM78_15150 [Ilumatobacteraceae bacterium]
MRRALGVIASSVFAIALVLLPAAPALAHGGSKFAVTSDYSTAVTSISPDTSGLQVKVIDIAGDLQLTWNGSGTVIVDGYSGEPSLRISAAGVERNIRSTATYLNTTRYITSIPPAIADDTAPPQWDLLTAKRSFTWHDHRTHWMSPIPPEQVQAHPDQTTVIDADWKIPLVVNGTAVTVNGTLSWVPPPSRAAWFGAAALIAIVIGLALFSRWWRRVTVGLAAIGLIAFLVDTFGYYHAAAAGSTNIIWVTLWPVVAVAATVWIAVDMRSRPEHPTLSVAILAVVLAVVGGIDRIDSIMNSEIYSTWPDWVPRACATASVAIAAAFLVRFLADVVPTLMSRPATIKGRRGSPASTGN